MPNEEATPAVTDIPCDLGEFLSARRNLPVETVNEELGDWLVAYEALSAARGRRPDMPAL